MKRRFLHLRDGFSCHDGSKDPNAVLEIYKNKGTIMYETGDIRFLVSRISDNIIEHFVLNGFWKEITEDQFLLEGAL